VGKFEKLIGLIKNLGDKLQHEVEISVADSVRFEFIILIIFDTDDSDGYIFFTDEIMPDEKCR
jgi:hypothetical protein